MLISAYYGSIGAAFDPPGQGGPGEPWFDDTFWAEWHGLDRRMSPGVVLGLLRHPRAPLGGAAAPSFGQRRGQPAQRGPATSDPPRRGVPAETAARS